MSMDTETKTRLPGSGWQPSKDPGFADLTGPIWVRDEDGKPVFAFVAEQKHTNRHGIVHGGMIMTFLDQALGISASQGKKNLAKVTIQMSVQFVAPARPGEVVMAQCEVVKATRSLIFMRGVASVGDRTLASAEGIWKLIGRIHEKGATA